MNRLNDHSLQKKSPMSKYSVRRIAREKSPALSRFGLATYLRVGFLPTPLSVYAHEYVVNDYDGKFYDELDSGTGAFSRDLRQFVGVRRRSPDAVFDEKIAREEIRSTLLNTTAGVTDGYEHVFLMVSGGKDSAAIAWALRELGRNATLIHCTNRGRENESPDVERLAKQLGYECLFLADDIELVDEFLSKKVQSLPIPMGDPAFFAYLRAVREINSTLDLSRQERVVLLDGMGNDSYMGHIPPKREKLILNLPRLSFLNEKIISLTYEQPVVHYALEMLFKRREERHFSGAFFAADEGAISPDLPHIFASYKSHPEERRALVRGGILDIDAGMRKGVLAATLDSRIDVAFPFLDPRWVKLFETFPEREMFDYPASLNKKILRNFLGDIGVASHYVKSAKGSFRFNLNEIDKVFAPSSELFGILSRIGIDRPSISRLQRASRDCFVSAQKLGVLYVLDRFLLSRHLPENFDDVGDNPISYLV